ncbi:MAG: calcium/sodium antiporter [Gammaproteobacteria bacterium]|nr:calcium/sodium antiporter [Gammaproteobacteria bacterium]
MLLSLLAVVGGLVLLAWSADHFVDGASATAQNLGVSTLIIGITIIGFGTSAPEILIALFAVFDGTPDLAIGNALGSNIANIGLILGVTALVIPITFTSKLLQREFPLLLLASALVTWVIWDAQLGLYDGGLLLLLLAGIMTYLIRFSRQDLDDSIEPQLDQEIRHDLSTAKALAWTLVALAVLVGSSKLLVWGAVNIATFLGISELVIGLTIVAIGTSLPELAASLAGARKGELDMIMGNIIGSNLFNTLGVIGVPALLVDFSISPVAITRDLPIMLGLTALLFLMAYLPRQQCCVLTRFKGAILLSGFVLYQGLLYYQTLTAN